MRPACTCVLQQPVPHYTQPCSLTCSCCLNQLVPSLPVIADSASVCWLQQPSSVSGMLPLGSEGHPVLPCNSQSPHLFAGAGFDWQGSAQHLPHHLESLMLPVTCKCSSLGQPAGWCPWAQRRVSKGRATRLPGPLPPHMVLSSIRRELASKPIGLRGSSHITSSRPSSGPSGWRREALLVTALSCCAAWCRPCQGAFDHALG